MTRHEDVVGTFVGEILHAGVLQLQTHDDGEEQTDQTGEDREQQVHRADVLVVRRKEPALKERRRVIVVVMRRVCRATHVYLTFALRVLFFGPGTADTRQARPAPRICY